MFLTEVIEIPTVFGKTITRNSLNELVVRILSAIIWLAMVRNFQFG